MGLFTKKERSMTLTKRFSSTSFRIALAIVFLFTQVFAPLALTSEAEASSGVLSASSHEGQLNPSGTYTTGNVSSYVDNDQINFRFVLDSDGATSGQMAVEFTETGNQCNFFSGAFFLGTHDSSNSAIANNSGITPSVTTNGAPTSSGSTWTQLLDVTFAGTGNSTVYYYLTLSNTASNCNGSSQRTTLANSQTPGDFTNMGRHSVPISAPGKDVQPAKITVTKYFDVDGDNKADRAAERGEWAFSLDGGAPVLTDSNGQVVFSVDQTGDYLVSESIPDGYSFIASRGTNCEPAKEEGVMSAQVVVSPNGNQNAECTFLNGIDTELETGVISVVKNAQPNGDHVFGFRITDNNNFTEIFRLDDDGSNDPYPRKRTFRDLEPGTYQISEKASVHWSLKEISCDGQFKAEDNSVWVNLEAGEHITCRFTNIEDARLTIVKEAIPQSDQVFTFDAKHDSQTKTFRLDDDPQTNRPNSRTGYVSPGHYKITERDVDGWELDSIECDGANYKVKDSAVKIRVPRGGDVTCTFTNSLDTETGDVKVTKFNDLNENGIYDKDEPTLEGWDIHIAPYLSNIEDDTPDHLNGPAILPLPAGIVTQTTGVDGTTTFEDLDTFPVIYRVSETQKEGWQLSNIYCENSDGVSMPLNGSSNGEYAIAYVFADETTDCYVGNVQDPSLEIAKSNNRPEPMLTGDAVTYTITITNPEDSSCVFGYPVDQNCGEAEDTIIGEVTAASIFEEPEEEQYVAVSVVDLPPAGFDYIPGSYTANSNARGDLKAQGITTEPTYASPGTWSLTSQSSNYLEPGEVVTLTYRAIIASSVSEGTYPDSAFASGFTRGGDQIYANVALVDDPFVGTEVTIYEPTEEQGFVLGTLVNTGFPAFVQIGLGAGLVGGAILTMFGDRMKKLLKFTTKSVASSLLATGLILALSSNVLAYESWQLNLVDLPDATGNSSVNLAYQVSTVDPSNTFSVMATQNGVNIGTQSVVTTYGDAMVFPVSFAGPGSYELKVVAEVVSGTNTGEVKTQVATVEYDPAIPASPTYDGKTRNGNTWAITFTVPAGSDSETIQVFASTAITFTADNTTLVGEVAATPGSQQTFTYTAPDSAERYFAIRALDPAGNISPLVGDAETTVTAASSAVSSAAQESSDGEVLAEEGSIDLEDEFDDKESSDGDSNNLLWLLVALAALGVAAGIYWQTRTQQKDQ